MVADLVEGADLLLGADGITTAHAGEAIGLGKSPHAQNVRARDIERRQSRYGRRFAVSLVKYQHGAGGQGINEAFDLRSFHHVPMGLSGLEK